MMHFSFTENTMIDNLLGSILQGTKEVMEEAERRADKDADEVLIHILKEADARVWAARLDRWDDAT